MSTSAEDDASPDLRDDTIRSADASEPLTADPPEAVTIEFLTNELATSHYAAPDDPTRPSPFPESGEAPTVASPGDPPSGAGKPERLTRIGRFQVERLLGSGAFGNVYLAADPHLERKVAIKVAKLGLFSTDEDRRRFVREARSVAGLRHPHIVPVYEFGQSGDSDYIVYEFIQGTNLRSILGKRRVLPIQQAVDLTIKIAGALDYAHQNKIVHRDVKPENILIDASGQPHVADFGCARQAESAGLLTVEGQVMGTPAYMSPEQASGQSHLADARSDVWSVGVMLEEMLTGQRPFKGTLTEILIGIRDHSPAPLRQIDHRIPRDIETICQKCLAKLPQERFQTAGELVDELERWRRGEPIRSRRTGLVVRTYRWSRRHPAIASLLAVIVAVTLLGTIISAAFATQAWTEQRGRAHDNLQSLLTAAPTNISLLLRQVEKTPFAGLVREELDREWQQSAGAGYDRRRVRTALGLAVMSPHATVRSAALDYLVSVLLEPPGAPVDELLPILDVLRGNEASALVRAKALAADVFQPRALRLRALVLIAQLSPNSLARGSLGDLGDAILAEPLTELPAWLALIQPVAADLRPVLVERFRDPDPAKGLAAASALAQLFDNEQRTLVSLVPECQPPQLGALVNALRAHQELAREGILQELETTSPDRTPVASANLALAALMLQAPDPVSRFLRQREDPTIRSEIIERLGATGIDVERVLARIHAVRSEIQGSGQSHGTPAHQELSGWILALGGFGSGAILSEQRSQLIDGFHRSFGTEADPQVHAACHWLLGHWGAVPVAGRPPERDSATAPPPGLRWRVDAEGHTLVQLSATTDCWIGSLPAERTRFYRRELEEIQAEIHGQVAIARPFEIATQEVSIGQYRRFEQGRIRRIEEALAEAEQSQKADRARELKGALQFHQTAANRVTERAGDPTWPVRYVSWWDAAAYCRWLSEVNGCPESEMVYPAVAEIAMQARKFSSPRLPPNAPARSGYRLPTNIEWEYACRAGSRTPWFWGDSESLAASFAWSIRNSPEVPHLPGQRKPNAFGLFDMLGNVAEWTHSDFRFDPLKIDAGNQPGAEVNSFGVAPSDDTSDEFAKKEYRGGSFADDLADLRSARRNGQMRFNGTPFLGFRVARTISGEADRP